MDAYEALQAIQRLARIAPASEQGQPAEVLLDIQRRALNGIALVAERALAKAPCPEQTTLHPSWEFMEHRGVKYKVGPTPDPISGGGA
jgi:hypothetical protein